MFLSRIQIPEGIADYEVHQHLHHQFTTAERVFLFRRVAPGRVVMLSIVAPRCPHVELPRDALRVGHPISFELDAIATVTQAGKRMDLTQPQTLRQWLSRQLDGAAVVRFARFDFRWMCLGNGVKRRVATCSGVLEITDVAEFSLSLQAGIGRTKHMGCGLIHLPELMG